MVSLKTFFFQLALVGLLAFAAQADLAFFDRKIVEKCDKNEPAKRCMLDTFDKLERINEAIAESRKFLSSKVALTELEDEMSRLQLNLDKRVGLQSIVTYLLVEDCTLEPTAAANRLAKDGEPPRLFSERDCKEDADFIPTYNTSLIQLYNSRTRGWLEDEELAKLWEPEERLMQVMFLAGKLQDEFQKQIAQRDKIKAGFWVSARYEARRRAESNMVNAYLANEQQGNQEQLDQEASGKEHGDQLK